MSHGDFNRLLLRRRLPRRPRWRRRTRSSSESARPCGIGSALLQPS